MGCVERLDGIELEMTMLGVALAPTVGKIVRTRLWWFGHVENVDSVVRRVD
jgi:hypothetical protein